MKRILIISYFFPPCNLTASQRVWGWVKYLHEYGYYPTVITRNWSNEIHAEKDIALKAGDEIEYKKFENCEVYYIPHKPNLRDRLLLSGRLPKLRKVLTFVELIGQSFSHRFLSYKKFLNKAMELSGKNSYKALIISGNPFHQFQIGYRINKKTKLPWIADYRDDWTTDELNKPNKLSEKLIRGLERKSEKKWVGTASFVTSVSPHYVNKIEQFTAIQGKVIYNGFLPEEFENIGLPELQDEFRLLYNGTLYPSQNIEIFIEGFKKTVEHFKSKQVLLKLQFPGVLYKPDQGDRIKALLKGYERHYELTSRLPRNELLLMQAQSHVLLMFAHQNLKGIPGSKIYEYLGYKKPILVSPDDEDILAQIIHSTRSGYICNTAIEVFETLKLIYDNYVMKRIESSLSYNNQIYTRKHQTAMLAKLFDQIINI